MAWQLGIYFALVVIDIGLFLSLSFLYWRKSEKSYFLRIRSSRLTLLFNTWFFMIAICLPLGDIVKLTDGSWSCYIPLWITWSTPMNMYLDVVRLIQLIVRFTPALRETFYVRFLRDTFVIKVGLVILALSYLLMIICAHVFDRYREFRVNDECYFLQEWYIMVPCVILCLGFLARITKLSKTTDDAYGVAQQMDIVSNLRGIFFGPLMVLTVVFAFVPGRQDYERQGLSFTTLALLGQLVGMVADLGWPLIKEKQFENTYRQRMANRRETSVASKSFGPSVTSEGPLRRVHDVLYNRQLKGAFTAHAQRALCIELIYFWDDVQPLLRTSTVSGRLPADFRPKLLALHERYIKIGSPYEINISSALHNTFDRLFKQYKDDSTSGAQSTGAGAGVTTDTSVTAPVRSPSTEVVQSSVTGPGPASEAWAPATELEERLSGVLGDMSLEIERLMATNIYASFVQSREYTEAMAQATRRPEQSVDDLAIPVTDDTISPEIAQLKPVTDTDN